MQLTRNLDAHVVSLMMRVVITHRELWTGLTCGSPHDPNSLEICDSIRQILPLEIVYLGEHMSVVSLCGNVVLGERGVTSVNYPSSHQTSKK